MAAVREKHAEAVAGSKNLGGTVVDLERGEPRTLTQSGTIEIVELVKKAGNVLKLRAKCTGIDAKKLIWARYAPTICFLLFVFQPDLIPSAACSGS